MSNTNQQQIDHHFMQLAIIEANKSIPVESAYCVGALIIGKTEEQNNVDGTIFEHYRVLYTGYSREIEGNTHAEQCCFIKLQQQLKKQEPFIVPEDWILYTTMEPCSTRLSGKKKNEK
jgi:pyrimidine deaminase RibD-like protein